MELMDGHKGYLKVCPGQSISGYTASNDLRDIHVHFNVINPPVQKNPKGQLIFNCTVQCSNRKDVNQLPTVVAPKINPKCCESLFNVL